jgi:hypothetical protein
MEPTIHELKSEVKRLKDLLHDLESFTRGCFKNAINAANPKYSGDLQKAVYDIPSEGGMLILPPNTTFVIRNPPLLIEKDETTAVGRVRTNVLITGGGMTSVIKAPMGYSGDLIKIAGAEKTSAQDIILENFFINGDKKAVTGIRLDLANQIITLRNLSIRDCRTAGIEAENNSCVNVFDSLRIRDCGSGVKLLQKGEKFGCNSVSIINCSINASAGIGVHVEHSTNVRITNCRIDGSGSNGVSLNGVRGLMISGCRFESNCLLPTITRDGVGQVAIGGNSDRENTFICEGVHIAGCYFTGIDPKTKKPRSPVGITVRNSEKSIIIGNHFQQHALAPIKLTPQAIETSIIGNSIIINKNRERCNIMDSGTNTHIL